MVPLTGEASVQGGSNVEGKSFEAWPSWKDQSMSLRYAGLDPIRYCPRRYSKY